MKTLAVINALGLRAPALRPLCGGAPAFDRVLAFARGLPGIEAIAVLARDEPPPSAAAAGVRVVRRSAWTTADLLETLGGLGEGHDDTFYFFADCPLLDAGLAARMHAGHRRYFADYTFADGFPAGLAPEILGPGTARRLRVLAGDGALATAAPDRETLFTVLRQDINSFDVETELSPVDLRMMRASLYADTERNFLLVSRLMHAGARDAESACRVLQESPSLLRTLPAWFPVQVVERCPQSCSYCPYPVAGGDPREKHGEMSTDSFDSLVSRIESFSTDAVVAISLWGEPSQHSQAQELARIVLSRPGLELVIETSGVGWKPAALEAIRGCSTRSPTWIVSLDAASPPVYAALRGDGFSEALSTVERLQVLFPSSTWVQAVRMKDNEEDLEAFYRAWKSRTDRVIIQKHDSFCGLLADRRVADLSPVSRFPCWHLMRDFPVLLDGTVPLCREEVRRGRVLGNAFRDELSAIWERGADLHAAHVRREYPGLCAGCDEYYTFNY
jgi:spiro-SPASM protein